MILEHFGSHIPLGKFMANQKFRQEIERYYENCQVNQYIKGMCLKTGNRSKYIFKKSYCTLSYAIEKNRIFTLKSLAVRKQFSSACGSKGGGKKKGYDQKLPPMPALPLKETLKKFMVTCQPLLTNREFQKTCKLVDDFLETDGPKLQKLLEEAAKNEPNWLGPRWLKYGYLQFRDSLCVGTSPAMTFLHRKFENDEAWIRFTARVIYCALKFKELVDNVKIPVEKMGKFELDMGQYFAVFGTNRTPCAEEDKLEFNPDSKHVAVAYLNNWYYVPVYSKNGKIAHPNTIYESLACCLCNDLPKDDKGIGILTAAHRNLWAGAYQELIKNKTNQKNVKLIQTCLFTVCLDEKVPYTEDNMREVLGHQTLHGGGSSQNAANRWFDKTIQLVVNRNGMNGFTYEHSPAEGQPVANMTGFIHKAISDEKFFESAEATDDVEPVKPLSFNVSSTLEGCIEKAKKECDALAQDLDMKVLIYQEYGKEFIKPYKLSPDSYCQMAMQCAYYKYYKQPGAQYESAHLRIYPGGRTETIRSCSNESAAFSDAMAGEASNKERWELLKKAVNGHRAYTNDALLGKGVDRHIFGLKIMALENDLKIHEFFNSPGVVKSSDFKLYTSQVASPYEIFMCYGASSRTSYGCCYNPRADNMIFACGSWKSECSTDSKKMADAIAESLDQMKEVLCEAGEKAEEKPKKKK